MKDYWGKISVVTGAASGIGRCIALALAERGSHLALVDLDEEGLARVRQEVEGLGVSATVHRVDVTNVDQVDALAREVEPAILVNCAGVALMAYAEATSLEEWRWVLDVNLWGPIIMVSAFLPALKKHRGYVVNIASADGVFAIPGSAAYSVSKFGLVGFSEVLGIELSGFGVGVTVVCPGFTWTPMVDSISIPGHDRGKVDRILKWLKPLLFTTPERLARDVVMAMERNKSIYVHTPAARIVYYIKRLSPRIYRDLVGRPLAWLLARLQ